MPLSASDGFVSKGIGPCLAGQVKGFTDAQAVLVDLDDAVTDDQRHPPYGRFAVPHGLSIDPGGAFAIAASDQA